MSWYGEGDLRERISKKVEGRINDGAMKEAFKNLSNEPGFLDTVGMNWLVVVVIVILIRSPCPRRPL